MRLPWLFRGLIVAFSALLAPIVAQADERDCQGVEHLSDNPKISLGAIGPTAARAYFFRNGADGKDCPNPSDKCRASSYLVPGDQIALSRTNGAFVCAEFIDVKGVSHAGWLLASDIVSPSPVALADWTGSWSREEATITIKPASKAGALSINGQATLGALDPDRIKRGSVATGEIEGVAIPSGANLSFTMGDDGATPPGDQTACKVWMARLGRYLLVSDNFNCGGLNVSFLGVYARK
jgi:hypothetical protein